MPSVDVDPDKHAPVNALCTVSFKLACGCNIRHSDPRDAKIGIILKRPGSSYPCSRHGEVVITRSSLRLVGWDEPGHYPEGWLPSHSAGIG